jgi:hypothetical protein
MKMMFGLKNMGATYQWCMQSYFEGQIGRNLEVYIDDFVIKTRPSSSLILDLEETFTDLRHFNIRLNLEKYTFGVPRGKLLGYIIIKRDIDANPNKISAIAKIGQVRSVKDVQWLMGVPRCPQPFRVPAGGTRTPLVQVIKEV